MCPVLLNLNQKYPKGCQGDIFVILMHSMKELANQQTCKSRANTCNHHYKEPKLPRLGWKWSGGSKQCPSIITGSSNKPLKA